MPILPNVFSLFFPVEFGRREDPTYGILTSIVMTHAVLKYESLICGRTGDDVVFRFSKFLFSVLGPLDALDVDPLLQKKDIANK